MNLDFLIVFALSMNTLLSVNIVQAADVTPSANPAKFDQNFYQVANQMYTHSGMPSAGRLLGWYAGRCASQAKPATRFAALLTTYKSGDQLKSVFWSDRDKPENYYDHPSAAMIKDIEDGLAQYNPDIPLLLPQKDYWEAIHLGAHKDATRTRANLAIITVEAFHDDAQTMSCLFFDRVR